MENSNNKFLIVGSIITAGALIAGAIIYTQKPANNAQTASVVPPDKQVKTMLATEKDHVLGNPDAELTLTLYFDINCGHCRSFHQTAQKLMEEYGKNGRLKWVSRHFPVLGPVSEKEAEATECAAEIGGNEKFWAYLDKLLEMPALAQDTLTNELVEIAQETGIEKDKFEQCLENNNYSERIIQASQEAVNLGAQGTPFAVITNSVGEIITTIPGALPYEQIKELIDKLLAN
ncbi:DsbA family protein [Patescibacteria group bacterium]|nr:DsbA family protein [Patescibacteria group bacterium]